MRARDGAVLPDAAFVQLLLAAADALEDAAVQLGSKRDPATARLTNLLVRLEAASAGPAPPAQARALLGAATSSAVAPSQKRTAMSAGASVSVRAIEAPQAASARALRTAALRRRRDRSRAACGCRPRGSTRSWRNRGSCSWPGGAPRRRRSGSPSCAIWRAGAPSSGACWRRRSAARRLRERGPRPCVGRGLGGRAPAARRPRAEAHARGPPEAGARHRGARAELHEEIGISSIRRRRRWSGRCAASACCRSVRCAPGWSARCAISRGASGKVVELSIGGAEVEIEWRSSATWRSAAAPRAKRGRSRRRAPAERAARGKPPAGRVTVSATLQGSGVEESSSRTTVAGWDPARNP